MKSIIHNLIYNILMIIILVLSINGCSTKNNTLQSSQISQTTTQETQEEDDFLDEFNDEMDIKESSDPLSGYNRVMTNFNDGLYEYFLRPISKGYKAVLHKEIRSSVGNFFNNIMYPIRLVNNLLQGKFANSSEETGRFVINTTIGIFGLFDPAKSYFDLKPHNEDFGQTLGFYGIGAGPHIVLPIFGPSNLRDTFSMVPDSMTNPIDYYDNRPYNLTGSVEKSIYLKGLKTINNTSFKGDYYDKMKEDAIDLYIYQKDMYEQYRQKQIDN